MPLDTILLILAAILFFYFLMIRPMRKQVAAQQELRNSLEVGSRVQLSSGMIATIKHLGDRQVIVELAPGVEVTVVKQAIGAIVRPEDEEFEYEDENPALDELDAPAGLEGEFEADPGHTEAFEDGLTGGDQSSDGQYGTEQNHTEQNSTEQNKGY